MLGEYSSATTTVVPTTVIVFIIPGGRLLKRQKTDTTQPRTTDTTIFTCLQAVRETSSMGHGLTIGEERGIANCGEPKRHKLTSTYFRNGCAVKRN